MRFAARRLNPKILLVGTRPCPEWPGSLEATADSSRGARERKQAGPRTVAQPGWKYERGNGKYDQARAIQEGSLEEKAEIVGIVERAAPVKGLPQVTGEQSV